MANNSEMGIKGNRVRFINSHLYVNGKDLNLKQWDSDPTMWSNRYGTKQSEYSGKSLEEVLKIKGLIWSFSYRGYFFYSQEFMKVSQLVNRGSLASLFFYTYYFSRNQSWKERQKPYDHQVNTKILISREYVQKANIYWSLLWIWRFFYMIWYCRIWKYIFYRYRT